MSVAILSAKRCSDVLCHSVDSGTYRMWNLAGVKIQRTSCGQCCRARTMFRGGHMGVRSTTACLAPAHLMHLLTLHTSPSCKSLLWTRAAYPKSTTLPPSPTVRYSPLTTAAITCCNKLFPWQPCNRGRSYIFLEPVPTTPISLVLRRV